MIFISKICGCRTSATQPISTLLVWKYMRLAMHGGSFVSSFRCLITHQTSSQFGLGASMTLIGLLPPLCENGNMLVDGGYSELHGIYMRNESLTLPCS